MINKGGDATVKAKRRTILSVSHLIVFLLSLSFFGSFLGTGDSQANPCMQMLMGGSTGTAEPQAACTTQTTPNDMETNAYSYFWIGESSGNKYLATKFTADATTGTVCKVCPRYNKVGSPTMDFSVKIYSNKCSKCDRSDDAPDASLGTYGTMNAANIAGSFGDCFDDASVELTNETIYWVVTVAATTDSNNYFRWIGDATCTTEQISRSTDGSTWTTSDITKCGMVKLYKVAE